MNKKYVYCLIIIHEKYGPYCFLKNNSKCTDAFVIVIILTAYITKQIRQKTMKNNIVNINKNKNI